MTRLWKMVVDITVFSYDRTYSELVREIGYQKGLEEFKNEACSLFLHVPLFAAEICGTISLGQS